MLYENSLILRTSVTEKPFVHKNAFNDFKTNFIFHEDLVLNILKLLIIKELLILEENRNQFLILWKYNPKIKGISAKKILGKKARINISMNINKFKRLIND